MYQTVYFLRIVRYRSFSLYRRDGMNHMAWAIRSIPAVYGVLMGKNKPTPTSTSGWVERPIGPKQQQR